MIPPLDGGTILITGASSGIGREFVRELAPVASSLVLVARRADRLNELKAELAAKRPELRVSVQPCDVGDLAAVDRMLAAAQVEVGPVDVLINNAGLGDTCLFECSAWEKLASVLQVNVVALTYLTKRLVGPMQERKRGGILNVSSGFGMNWMPGVAVYCGSKHYVTAFTDSLRSELAGTGVVVTQVCPGPVATEFESVAGNPTGMAVPKLLELDPRRVARAALRGFRRGQAMVVPGFWIGLMIGLGRFTPRPMLRWVFGGIGGFLRKKRADRGSRTRGR